MTAVIGLNVPVIEAKTNINDYLDYVKPNFKRPKNLNQSQDRLIKKQNIKKSALAVAKYVENNDIGIFLKANLTDLQVNYPKNADFTRLNQFVEGVVVRFPWSQIQLAEDNLDFSKIDEALAWCKLHHKMLILEIPSTGLTNTPNWLNDSDVKFITYKDKSQRTQKMVLPWDDVYLARWSNFLLALGKKYDGNPYIHSVSITGGGFDTNTSILPNNLDEVSQKEFMTNLNTNYKLSQKTVVENWKFMVDSFAKAFPATRLNFGLNPPIPKRIGEDSLDEISNYFIFRYGRKIYLTRQNVVSVKNTFDDYRLITKFHNDTYTGLSISKNINAGMFMKISKWALSDGVSIIQMPYQLLSELTNTSYLTQFRDFRRRLGYQIALEKVAMPENIEFEDDIPVTFNFYNNGIAPAINSTKEADKEIPASYKIEITFKDENNKVKAISYHTPNQPTNTWKSNSSVTWTEDLKTPGIEKGRYTLYLSLVDKDSHTSINMLNILNPAKPEVSNNICIGKINIK